MNALSASWEPESGEIADGEVPAGLGPPGPDSFASLYRLHLPAIYTYIRARTGCQEDAIDLTQQVFLNALRALPTYRDRGIPFRSWLYRIARNAVVDFHRRRRHDIPWEDLPEIRQPTEDGDADAAIIERERLERLRQVLGTIPAQKRELLLLRFSSGLSVREIAAVVGRTEAAVKTEIRRTLRNLREHYDAD